MAEALARLARVTLLAARDCLSQLDVFYEQTLGLLSSDGGYHIGASELAFKPADGRPFYHFALLVPGNRFEVALSWAQARVELLPDARSDETVLYFSGWDVHACYFHDPAGNIVELIAHHGIGESTADGAFEPDELLQVCEIGMVGDRGSLAADLAALGLEITQGSVDEPGGLAFLGPPTSSVILSDPGRGWLPQGRPAERHPVELVLAGRTEGQVRTEGHRVRQIASFKHPGSAGPSSPESSA